MALRAGILFGAVLQASATFSAKPLQLGTLGWIKGTRNDNTMVDKFEGVKYGSAQRWKSPTALADGAYGATSGAATDYGTTGSANPAKCPELPASGATPAAGTVEDCLTLSIYVADSALSAATLPVMVFFPGGGYTTGGPSQFNGEGTVTASGNKAVVVTVGYRLGIFGFLNSDEILGQNGGLGGNLGIQDQRLALQWIQTNIQYFGGDKTKVMIHGQSAGGNSVINHLVQPASYSLYSSAIIQSGANNLITDTAYANDMYQKLKDAIGVGTTLATLQAQTTTALQNFAKGLVGKFWPTIDGITLTGAPMNLISQGNFNKNAAIIVGSVRDEWWYFTTKNGDPPSATADTSTLDSTGPTTAITGMSRALTSAEWTSVKAAYSAPGYDYPSSLGSFTQSWWTLQRIQTDRNSGHCSARLAAKGFAAATTKSVYMYLMTDGDFASSNTPTGHTTDNSFIFPSVASPALTSAQTTQSTAMINYWVNFAQTGNPNTGATTGLVNWPAWTSASDNVFLLQQGTFAPQSNLRKAACDFWDSVQPYNFQPWYMAATTTTAAATTTATTVAGGTTTVTAAAGTTTVTAAAGTTTVTAAAGTTTVTAAPGATTVTTVTAGTTTVTATSARAASQASLANGKGTSLWQAVMVLLCVGGARRM